MIEPEVNIAIFSEDEIQLELYGNFSVEGMTQYFRGPYTAKLSDSRIKIINPESEFIVDEISFVPATNETEFFRLRNVTVGKGFHWERKENQRFFGGLKLIIENDNITAINFIKVEDYITSVISSEMSDSSPIEFLKAHAIISRSWIIRQIENRKESTAGSNQTTEINTEDELIKWFDRESHLNYDVCSNDHCQRYYGVTKVYSDTAMRAVRETRGLALTFKGKICDTRYSKCCGGITESFENVWAPVHHPYLSSIADYKFEPDGYDLQLSYDNAAEKWIDDSPPAFCNTANEKILSQVLVDFDQETKNFFRWKVEYTQEEIKKLLVDKSGIDFGDIVDLTPLERGNSGRIIKLKITGTKKTFVVGKELEIRRMLSETHLYSSAFKITKSKVVNKIPQKFILNGAGWGHGVGLCQIGAAVMSNMGYSFDEILLHYFKQANIEKIYR